MKINITAFLIKKEKTEMDIVSDKKNLRQTTIHIQGDEANFYWRKSASIPKWARLFSIESDIKVEDMQGTSTQGLLVIKRKGRLFCFTFGHARHLINPTAIERYFGLKAALSMSDPELIKSIDKSNIDKTPLRSRSQSSKYVSLSEFEFRFDWEILKSLTGIVEDDKGEEYEVISGSDPVSLYTDTELHKLPILADRLWESYSSSRYKEKYPWIDYIVPVRDKGLINRLDQILIGKINQKEYAEIWIAPPDLIEYKNFSGFCYRRPSGKTSPTTHPDLDLESCLTTKKIAGQVDAKRLKSTQIFLYDADHKQIDSWGLYSCLNGEIEHENHSYLLSEGEWYQIEKNFNDQINKYFNSFPISDINLPNYSGMHENEYLSEVCKNEKLHLMDRKLIKPKGATSNIEFCDILTDDHHLIHVKKYSSSSVLSHLFSQAYFSAETLLREPEVVDQINRHLGCDNYEFSFNPKEHPRNNKIIIAIMQKRPGKLHMPFFSKVNFKQYSQRLLDMGFRVELKKIEI